MKLIDLCDKYFESKAACARAFGTTPATLYDWIRQGREVEQLVNGDYVLMSSKTMICEILTGKVIRTN